MFRSRRRSPRRPTAGERPRRGARWLALTSVLAAPLAGGCFAEASPQPLVTAFLLAWQSGNHRGAASLTTGDPRAVETALRQVREQLDSAALSLELDGVTKSGDQGAATFTVHVDLGENGAPWDYQSKLAVRRAGQGWKVVWSPSIIHPRLGPGQRLAVVTENSPREPIQDAAGRSLVRDTKVEIAGVYPGALKNAGATIGQLAKATGLDGERLLGRVRAARPHAFFPLLTLRLPDQAADVTRLRGIPGLSFRRDEIPVAAASAPELIGTLGAATAQRLQEVGAPYQPGDTIGTSGMQLLFQRRLAGTPGVKVVTEDPTGRQSAVLQEWRGLPSAAVTTTIDRRVQLAAQRSLMGHGGPAALVAVHAPTGRVMAVANHRTNGQNLALSGQLPPGMAFTIVTSEALLEAGQQLSGSAPCPKTQRVGGRMFRNPGPGPVGDEPSFRAGFAASCATAFAGLASRLGTGELAASAGRFGIGADWGLPVATFPGAVPQTSELAESAAMMVGEGQVRMSPLAMALVAGAVESGTWRPPRLITDPPAPPKAAALPLDADRLEDLRKLMRSSVSAGTAQAANLRGSPVFGVVSTVEYAPGGQKKTVSWFVGFRGDTAFAVAMEGKASVSKAAAKFLRAL
jgi:cell division protein FtsI/penicillin-binding protein 2